MLDSVLESRQTCLILKPTLYYSREDDIADYDYNPTPGVIWNYPGGPDVYHGVPKDYTGRDVNSVNFLKVLQGQEMSVGSGKTVKVTTYL